MAKGSARFPQCGDRVIHLVYGPAVVSLIDPAYQRGRGWIHCIFDCTGGFGCFADEVTLEGEGHSRASQRAQDIITKEAEVKQLRMWQ